MSNINVWEQAPEPGIRRKILPPGQGLMMMEVQFLTGSAGYEHSHPHEQMSYCIWGRFEFTIGGERYEVGPGDTVRMPGGVPHSVRCLETGTLLDCFTPIREDLIRR